MFIKLENLNTLIFIMKKVAIMSLTKQAKVLSDKQVNLVLLHLSQKADAVRNRAMFLLSVDAGLRAKEIASVEWGMVLDAEGNLSDAIALQNKSAKGSSGGIVYISKRLHEALAALKSQSHTSGTIIKSKRTGGAMSAQVITNCFFTLYRDCGFEGCSSHSGRRTAITRWAHTIASVGGSMREVQQLARHSSLEMTQRYIQVSDDAMRRVVG